MSSEALMTAAFYLFAGGMLSLATSSMWKAIYRHDFPLSYKDGDRPWDMLIFNIIGWPVVTLFCVMFWLSLPEKARHHDRS